MMTKEMQNLKDMIAKIALDHMETLIDKRDEDSAQRLIDNHEYFSEVFDQSGSDFNCLVNLTKRLSKSQSLSRKEFTLIAVFMYLLIAEGIICNLLNYLTYLLVTSGHDLYSLTKRKYVKDYLEEIGKVEMSTKIQFLKHHGFGIVTKEYDSTFRNDLAHHNYKIDEKGFLWVRGKRVRLSSKLDRFIKISKFMTGLMQELNRRGAIFLSQREKKFTKS